MHFKENPQFAVIFWGFNQTVHSLPLSLSCLYFSLSFSRSVMHVQALLSSTKPPKDEWYLLFEINYRFEVAPPQYTLRSRQNARPGFACFRNWWNTTSKLRLIFCLLFFFLEIVFAKQIIIVLLRHSIFLASAL